MVLEKMMGEKSIFQCFCILLQNVCTSLRILCLLAKSSKVSTKHLWEKVKALTYNFPFHLIFCPIRGSVLNDVTFNTILCNVTFQARLVYDSMCGALPPHITEQWRPLTPMTIHCCKQVCVDFKSGAELIKFGQRI